MTKPEEYWEAVLAAVKKTTAAYNDLISASDAMADLIGCDRDLVLRRVVFPIHSRSRREPERIMDWATLEKERIMEAFNVKRERDAKGAQVIALIKRLNLTEEEKAILGL